MDKASFSNFQGHEIFPIQSNFIFSQAEQAEMSL